MNVPADVLLVNRVMGLLSGLGKTLDSRVNLFATLMPYAQNLIAAQPTACAEIIDHDKPLAADAVMARARKPL